MVDKNQNNIQNDYLFKTSNFALAAALSLYEPLESIYWRDNKTAEFIFIKTANLERYIDKYFSSSLLVEAQNYYNQLKQMKSRLHERI